MEELYLGQRKARDQKWVIGKLDNARATNIIVDENDTGHPCEEGTIQLLDPLYGKAKILVEECGKVSISRLQKELKVSFNHATFIVLQLERIGLELENEKE